MRKGYSPVDRHNKVTAMKTPEERVKNLIWITVMASLTVVGLFCLIVLSVFMLHCMDHFHHWLNVVWPV